MITLQLYSNRQETECARILANTGKVDWNKADSWGRTPLYWALEGGHSDKLDRTLQQPNIDYNVLCILQSSTFSRFQFVYCVLSVPRATYVQN